MCCVRKELQRCILFLLYNAIGRWGWGSRWLAAQLTGPRDEGEREPLGAASRHRRTVDNS